MQPTDYHCKICKAGRVAYYDDACPIKQLDVWKKALTCDRCYKFRNDFLRAKENIINLCYLLKNSKPDVAKIRENVTKVTQLITKLCSDYYRIQNTWDIDFVHQIMQRPMHSLRVIDAYHAGIKKLAAA